MSNIMFYDIKTHQVKTATHGHFDKGMNDMENPPPKVLQLKKSLGKPIPSETNNGTPPTNLN
eukprot:4870749-Ditylum_brightwellii.AAC.1